MLKITKERLNSLKNSPFIALLSYDSPELDIVCTPEDAKKFGIKFKLNAKNDNKIKYELQKFPIKFSEYESRFNRVLSHIKNGEISLLNLCFKTRIKTNLSMDEIYAHVNAKALVYKQDDFICFTPEPFVKIENGRIHTYPMKGTISADIENAREILLADKKEIREQKAMVELMQDELLAVAEDVRVEKFRFIERVGALYQTSSHVSGRLRENLGFGDIFEALLPAGSIAGSPKKRACEAIKECEVNPRGFYTGIFIHFDGQILQSFVLIRFVKREENGLYFYSGGGITAASEAKREYDELLAKVNFPI
ncbi:aminodeoxychorismate synthase component I [Campylobacter sp.]|uniref:aminodeoxychorismate synthase component I n=1 Tax=Campylobacter sp. TaxID=205 RepID=UPI0027104ECC|nr:aminodeoxychorismate synthase component I [Campylobacter sp.]